MLTFIISIVVMVSAYLAMGYVFAIAFIARHKAGGKWTGAFMEGGTDYKGLVPLWLIASMILCGFIAAETLGKVKTRLQSYDFSPVNPESVVDKVRNRNKLVTIIEGRESEDG